MRPGQNNFKNRNRNRNRRHSGGGSGGGGGPNNRVLDSNGPDVKLRGTPQTIAEKYMQLARDAASSGDRVMAESYYQHADHYYRLWLAAQPAGQPIHFSRRPDDDVEDLEGGEGDEDSGADAPAGDSTEGAAPSEAMGEGEIPPQDDGYHNRQNRNRDNRDGRDFNGNGNANGQSRNRNRWPRRDRNWDSRDNQAPATEGTAPAADAASDASDAPSERPERQDRPERNERRERFPRRERPEQQTAPEPTGDWEAPSFLKRSMPAVAESDGEGDAQAVERKPRAKRPRWGEDDIAPNDTPPDAE
jgi:Domain of unknown function (DUF4167)